MAEFAMAHAADAPAQELAERCAAQLMEGGAGHTLGFVYATAALADALGDVLATLRERTGIADWAGTVGLGVCAGDAEYFDRPALVALSAGLPAGAHAMIGRITEPGGASGGPPSAAGALGVVHGDPRNPGTAEIVAALARRREAFLVGGLTCAEDRFPQIAGEVVDGGVSGVLIAGEVPVAVGLSQGCSPIGTVHEVTEAEDQIVVALDDRPALEVLLEDVGVAAEADPRPWLRNVHAALPVRGSDTGDYLVRNLVGIEPAAGIVVIGDRVEAGQPLLFVRRDAEAAAKDLKRMLAGLKARTNGPPRGGLYFSCVARGPNLFEDEAHELKAIREAFGPFPLAGFYGNGEISHDRLYGYTGVLALFL